MKAPAQLALHVFLVICAALTNGITGTTDRCVAASSVIAAGASTKGIAASNTKPVILLTPSPKGPAADASVAAVAAAAEGPIAYGDAEERPFDTPLGKGKWSIMDAADGKTYVTVKVQFKYQVKMNDFVMGTEFEAPLTGTSRQFQRFLSTAARLYAGVVADLESKQPYVYAPFVSYATAMHVSKEAPEGAGPAISHDTALYDGKGKNMAFYKKAANRANLAFTTDVWWTFVVVERNDLATNTISFAKWLNADKVTGSQPFQYMLKDKATGEQLFAMDLWSHVRAQGFVENYCVN